METMNWIKDLVLSEQKMEEDGVVDFDNVAQTSLSATDPRHLTIASIRAQHASLATNQSIISWGVSPLSI